MAYVVLDGENIGRNFYNVIECIDQNHTIKYVLYDYDDPCLAGHTYDTQWTHDTDFHWHAATCEHTDEVADKAAHSWDDGNVTLNATCTTEGVRTYTCIDCKKTKIEKIAATGHRLRKEETKAAICTEDGHKEYYQCAVCEKYFLDNDCMNVISDIDAWLKGDGLNAKTGHSFDIANWSSDEDSHWHAAICEHTGEVADKAAHSWDNGKVTKYAYVDAEGEKTFTCTICNRTKKEIIPKLTPTEEPTQAPTSTSTSTPTQAPTSAPTSTPTQAPISTPTSTPTQAPISTPTSTPTQAPTSAPTSTPTQAPISTPTSTPTQAPISTPTSTPTQAPTSAPTSTPTQAPISTPTSAPTQAPTSAPTVIPAQPTAGAEPTGTPEPTGTEIQPTGTENTPTGTEPTETENNLTGTVTTPEETEETVTTVTNEDGTGASIPASFIDSIKLTKNEQKAIEGGAEIKLEVSADRKNATKTEKKNAQAATDEIYGILEAAGVQTGSGENADSLTLAVGPTYNVKMTKQVGDGEKKAVKTNGNEASFTVTVPVSEKLLNTDASQTRLYFMVSKNADGTQNVVLAKLDAETNTLSFEATGNGKVTLVTTDVPYFEEIGTEFVTSAKLNAKYVITAPGNKAGQTGTVGYTAPQKKKASITIKDTVRINGITYKIVSIEEGAFAGNKKLKKLTIGKNIRTIGAGAFKGCKNLKEITINSTKLKAANLSTEAFEGLREDVVIYVPEKKLKAYTRMFKKFGVKAEVKAIIQE